MIVPGIRAHKSRENYMETVKFLALGGEEDVTRNMYLYEYQD
jgi:mRNA degradation ribonuclease J1/J2